MEGIDGHDLPCSNNIKLHSPAVDNNFGLIMEGVSDKLSRS